MVWGVVIVVIALVFVGYVVVQGTRAARAWRKAAGDGDVGVIKQILDDAINSWSSMRRPKEVPSGVWRGIQSMNLVEVGPDSVHVSCQAESEYRLQDGRWVETSNPLQEGMAITARGVDMIFYELPYFRPESVQIDVYTTYRGPDGSADRQCVLSTPATRELVQQVDWDEWSAAEIVEALGGHYQLGESDRPLPVAPVPSATSGGNGHRSEPSS